jgi:DNA processing protein
MRADLDLIRLSLVKGLTPRAASVLIETFGGPREAFRRSPQELVKLPDIGKVLASRIADPPTETEARAEVRRAERRGVRLLHPGREGYPALLGQIADPPIVLYVLGEIGEAEEMIAVVGARRASVYGRVQAERFAAGFARAGLTVVSGLARGIDAVAHRAALDSGGRTVAVLGSGVDRIYPPEHRALAKETVARGAVCSEFPLGSGPLAYHFPRRNRIIAGLGRAVFVVEGRLKSGSLITARLAADSNRDVFALPGRVDTELAAGPHSLIRDGAGLAECPEHVLTGIGVRPLDAPEPPPLPEDPLQRRILEDLAPAEPRAVDEILRRTGEAAPAVLAALTALELSGRVKALPGRRYIRTT